MSQFKLRDLLAAVFMIAIGLALFIPLIQKAREEARRSSCANNFKNIALALHNYHSAYQQLPQAMGGTASNGYRLSGLVALLPFVGAGSLWEQISNPMMVDGGTFPSMGPSPENLSYPPWREPYLAYQCPTDGSLVPDADRDFGRTNYTFCIGDNARNLHVKKPLNEVRGMFSPRVVTTFADVTDGLSNTIMAGEIANAQRATETWSVRRRCTTIGS